MTIANRIGAIFPAAADIPEFCRLDEPVEQREYLVNGELRRWDGPWQEAYSPVCIERDGNPAPQLVGRFPLQSAKESREALQAALAAYDRGRGAWPEMTIEDRIRHVEDFAFRMTEQKAAVVRLLMWEVGKSLKDSEKEFDRTVIYIKDTINAVKDLDRSSSRFLLEDGIIGQVRRAPVGVALCLGPYNYPLNETLTAVIPALIMGNAVIFKPPKLGVLLYGPLLRAFQEAFPPGVVNTVYGRGAEVVGPLMASGEIDVLAFVGTSKVANTLSKQHPRPNRLRVSLGLEAKNPAIVMPGANLEVAAAECLAGTLSFNGQRCTALKLLYVHQAILDEFLERFTQLLDQVKFGMPWEPQVLVTPLPEPDRPDYLTELVADALAKGARVINRDGGARHRSFYYPALLCPVNQSMRVYHEEQFGPLIPVVPFDDLDAILDSISRSNYGQQVSIFGEDSDIIGELVDRLVSQVGRVNLNSQCQRGPDILPFTGRKDSMQGTLSVHDALRVFSLRTLVAAKETAINKKVITEIVREHKSNFLSTDFIL